MKIAAFWFQIF